MMIIRSLSRILLFCVGMALLADPVSGQSSRTVNRTVELDRDGHVQLDTFTGKIGVTTWDRAQVEVEARIESDDSELVDETALRFDRTARRLSIEVDYDEVEDSQKFLGLFNIGDVDRPEVHFTITMPRTAGLSIDDFSSEIEVQGLRADVMIETFSSSIHVRDVEGTLDLETFSGSVEGEALRGSVQFEAFSGDARLRMDALTGDCRFETFSGDVELTLPAGVGFELVAGEDTFGALSSEFALRIEEGRRIAGEGGPRIDVETFSGDLRLRKQ